MRVSKNTSKPVSSIYHIKREFFSELLKRYFHDKMRQQRGEQETIKPAERASFLFAAWRAVTPWCNGSTRDFGSLDPGSNPGGVAILFF